MTVDTIPTTADLQAALRQTDTTDLLRSIESLTHRIASVQQSEHRAHRVGLADHLREQRAFAEREIERRCDIAERALATVEAMDRLLTPVCEYVDGERPISLDQAGQFAAAAKSIAGNLMASVVKDVATSDRIAARARRTTASLFRTILG